VAVEVERYSDARMAQALLRHLGMNATRQKLRRVPMDIPTKISLWAHCWGLYKIKMGVRRGDSCLPPKGSNRHQAAVGSRAGFVRQVDVERSR
jgi:hypothetical protein